MPLRYLVPLLLTLCFHFVHAQTSYNTEFASFAMKQDSLFIRSYEQRDPANYSRLLSEFETKYSRLDSAQKKAFTNYYFNALYNFSCTYSLLGNRQKALDYLDLSIKNGYYDYAHILGDSDLNNIRNDARFRNMILPLRETGDYLYILKKSGTYNTNEHRELPVFTYQPADNPHLAALRQALNLDSIAGSGNDVSRIMSLMHWIHNLIPHDGSHGNPEVRNAMNMIAVCKKEGRGLNCRGLATVLNECYLALGYRSRFVTCLPKDSLGVDNDCHVINMVFVPSLKKWIWIDPTFDAYVMNEKGELLGLEEVRERLVNNQALILNPDANWNHRASETKEYYLYTYMAKNLYRLECSASSEYDLETRTEGKTLTYVQLLPVADFRQSPSVSHEAWGNTKAVIYKTNDPGAFWHAPVN